MMAKNPNPVRNWHLPHRSKKDYDRREEVADIQEQLEEEECLHINPTIPGEICPICGAILRFKGEGLWEWVDE